MTVSVFEGQPVGRCVADAVENVDELEAVMVESNPALLESYHALYCKYLAELEHISM